MDHLRAERRAVGGCRRTAADEAGDGEAADEARSWSMDGVEIVDGG
jgi:hypothetical protein